MSSSYLYHCLHFKAQSFARNLFFKGFLLQKPLDSIEKIILKSIHNIFLGNKPLTKESDTAVYKEKVFIYDFEKFYTSFYEFANSSIEEPQDKQALFEEWASLLKKWKEEFISSQSFAFSSRLYLLAQALIETNDYDNLMELFSKTPNTPIKDYCLRVFAVNCLKNNNKEKAVALLKLIVSSFERCFLLGELARQALLEKNESQAKNYADSINDIHLKFCLMEISQSIAEV